MTSTHYPYKLYQLCKCMEGIDSELIKPDVECDNVKIFEMVRTRFKP